VSDPSERQVQVLAACLQAGSRKEAAESLGLSLRTIDRHLSQLYIRLGVDCQTDAAKKLGWLQIPETVGISPT
jgi:DNA-binding NarL/FixJ family response regulator